VADAGQAFARASLRERRQKSINQYDSIVVNFTIVEHNGELSISKQVIQTFDTHKRDTP
jgi:hypothetical protein